MTAKMTAQKIRTALRTEFPAQRFSVTTHRGGEFDMVNVTWTAGPARASVDVVASAHATVNTFVTFNNSASA